VVAALSEPVLHLPIEAGLLLIAAIVVKRGFDVLCGCP
jgi:hypothetical protein